MTSRETAKMIARSLRTGYSVMAVRGMSLPRARLGLRGDAGHKSRVKTIMENRVAGCKVVARISCSITPHHSRVSTGVGTSRFRLLRQATAGREPELSGTGAKLAATTRQPGAAPHD